MKILRFNESNVNWDKQKIDKNIEDNEYLFVNFSNYLNLKIGYNEEDDGLVVTEYFFDRDGNFIINFKTNYDFEQSYNVDDFNDMLNFINNPNLYIDSNKYNL